jgi:hypothetical protein
VTNVPFITDDELRERGTPELTIDRLDRKVETQKMANGSRDRAAVETFIRERNQRPDV